MSPGFSKSQIALAVAAVLGTAFISTLPGTAKADNDRGRGKDRGTYVAGDIHNHTTCSDGSISMQKLVRKSMDRDGTPWGLDWFVQAGHGGSGNRNCTLAEDATLATPAYPLVFAPPPAAPGTIQGPTTTWQNTNVTPPIVVKGRVQGTPPAQVMWRWQSIQEFQYPLLEYLSALRNQPLFMGMESVAAGHEHVSMSVITGQMPSKIFSTPLPGSPPYKPLGNATALSQWSYCFDRGDTDTSRGNATVGTVFVPGGNNWECSVPGSQNSTDPALGWDTTAQKLIPAGGTGTGDRGHSKTVEAMKWMAQFHPNGSYWLPTHLERAGPFNPAGNNGFNVENLRNTNNAAPKVAFGMETQPGHHASDTRGEYTIRRNNIAGVRFDSVGGTTFGGTGIYGALIGGVWDALLGEGRNYWFFASSDWHNRGMFGPDDRRSTQDFYPGEYQRNYTMVRHGDHHHQRHQRNAKPLTPQSIVDGLRTGNTWVESGQLIDRLAFVACVGRGTESVEALALDAARDNTDVDHRDCATMGEKLEVRRGEDVVVAIAVRDPDGTNFSLYTFDNPSLAQIGISQPLNKPVLEHVDVIRGMVTGYKTPGAADYSGQWPDDWVLNNLTLADVPAAAKNTTAALIKTFNEGNWETPRRDREFKVMSFRLRDVKATQYIRLRGTNLPPALPFETDADGNPLTDLWTNPAAVATKVVANPPAGDLPFPEGHFLRIPCNTVGATEFDGCPSHMGTRDGQKFSSFDVAAWADLWFYSNPIYIEVRGSTKVAGVE